MESMDETYALHGRNRYIQADSDRGQAHGFVYRYVRPLENVSCCPDLAPYSKPDTIFAVCQHNGRRFTINAPHELSNWLLFDGTRWLQTRG